MHATAGLMYWSNVRCNPFLKAGIASPPPPLDPPPLLKGALDGPSCRTKDPVSPLPRCLAYPTLQPNPPSSAPVQLPLAHRSWPPASQQSTPTAPVLNWGSCPQFGKSGAIKGGIEFCITIWQSAANLTANCGSFMASLLNVMDSIFGDHIVCRQMFLSEMLLNCRWVAHTQPQLPDSCTLNMVQSPSAMFACAYGASHGGCRPRGACGAHHAPGHVRLAASMTRCTCGPASPRRSVISLGAMLCGMASSLGYLIDAVRAVRGRHPHDRASCLSSGTELCQLDQP